MSTGIYGNVSGAARKAKGLYGNVSGVTREVKSLWANVGGVTRKVYSGYDCMVSFLNRCDKTIYVVCKLYEDGSGTIVLSNDKGNETHFLGAQITYKFDHTITCCSRRPSLFYCGAKLSQHYGDPDAVKSEVLFLSHGAYTYECYRQSLPCDIELRSGYDSIDFDTIEFSFTGNIRGNTDYVFEWDSGGVDVAGQPIRNVKIV